MQADFRSYKERKLIVDRVQVENSYFRYSSSAVQRRLDAIHKPKCTVPLKYILVPVSSGHYVFKMSPTLKMAVASVCPYLCVPCATLMAYVPQYTYIPPRHGDYTW